MLALLIAVFSFLDFVDELDETANANYEVTDAAQFVLLTTPVRALSLIPATALLASLLGLGMLDHGRELIAMRAAGVSSRRIGWSVMKAGLLLMLLVATLAEFIVPGLAQRAWTQRTIALSGDTFVQSGSGEHFWHRDGHRFISVRDMAYGQIPTDIDIYEFGEAGDLKVFIHAAKADLNQEGHWVLINVEKKEFVPGDVHVSYYPTLEWQAFLSPQQGAVTELDVESLAPTDLYAYARDLRARGENAERYELALWRKINIPFATGAMVLLSVAFVFGAFSRTGIAKRIVYGAGVGIAFYLGDQILAQAGLLLGLEPALTATAPVLLLFGASLLMLQRVA